MGGTGSGRIRLTEQERILSFWKRVNKTDDCWLWTAASTTPSGYGQLWDGTKLCLASRFSWQLHFGAIPEGMCVLHKCDTPLCVRPEHLFLGTKTDNNLDKVAKGRSSRLMGSLSGMAKLDEAKVKNIKRFLRLGIGMKSIAKEFSVCPATIWMIATRRTWRHVA